MHLPSKIAIICNYELLPQRVGGMDYFFWNFDRKCKENDIMIDWFFPNTADHGEYSYLNVIASGAQPETFFLGHLERSGKHYSHIMVHFVELCTRSLKSIKSKTGAQLIVVDHNPRPLGGYSFKKKIEKRLKGFFYSRFIDVFVAVSEATKAELIFDFGNFIKPKTIVIFNGLQPEKFLRKPKRVFTGKYIIASHLRKSKGIQDVITAVRALQLEGKTDFVIHIYGSGPMEEGLTKMVSDFSLESVINFKGSVATLNETYQDYDYLIHPSHAETFCYTIVESLMSNLPVITTEQGNVLGLIENGYNGFLYSAGNTAQLESILCRISSGALSVTGNAGDDIRLNALTLDSMVENYFKLIK
ncbi:glycosyltransferase family 4 protein [Flavobacterium sp.]|uniref:glycosyltransferase family 4 protein n=1 Tax=Flavobacterium sp. TaxID=239 RepID=UPI00261283AB|nr:glycosyltransferase family 4 protein [Flavobacterium sp.]